MSSWFGEARRPSGVERADIVRALFRTQIAPSSLSFRRSVTNFELLVRSRISCVCPERVVDLLTLGQCTASEVNSNSSGPSQRPRAWSPSTLFSTSPMSASHLYERFSTTQCAFLPNSHPSPPTDPHHIVFTARVLKDVQFSSRRIFQTRSTNRSSSRGSRRERHQVLLVSYSTIRCRFRTTSDRFEPTSQRSCRHLVGLSVAE